MINRLRRAFEPLRARALKLRNRLLEKPAILLLYRTGQETGRDRVGDLAAAMAYFAILSTFPLLLGVVAILGFFLPSETISDELINVFQRNFPGAVDLLRTNIERIIEVRNTLGILSLIGLFWTGSGLFGALGRAVNTAWGITFYRPWFKRKARDLLLALGTGVLLLLSLGITLTISIVSLFNLPIPGIAEYGGRVLSFLLAFGTFVLVYKYLPNARIPWRGILPGAFLVAVLFEIARSAFTLYLMNFANYEIAYGPIASFIILLVWIYYSAFIVLFGAEFSAEYIKLREELRRGIKPQPMPSRVSPAPVLVFRTEEREAISSPLRRPAKVYLPSTGEKDSAIREAENNEKQARKVLPAFLAMTAFPFLAFRLRRRPRALFLLTVFLINLVNNRHK